MLNVLYPSDVKFIQVQNRRIFMARRIFEAREITNKILQVAILENRSSNPNSLSGVSYAVSGTIVAGIFGFIWGLMANKPKFHVFFRIYLDNGQEIDIETDERPVIETLMNYIPITRRR